MSTPYDRIWVERMSGMTIFFGLSTAALSVALADLGLWSVFTEADATGWLIVLMGAVGLLFAISVCLRPRLEARSGGLLIRNPILEYWVPWPEVEGVQAGMRVQIHTRSGSIIESWAVQKTNLSAILNRGSRTERVAARLMETVKSQERIPQTDGRVERKFAPASRTVLVTFTVLIAAEITIGLLA